MITLFVEQPQLDHFCEGGRLECNLKYIEKNCFIYFPCMQRNYRGVLTLVAWNDCHEAIIVRGPLLPHHMLRKQL